MSTQIQFAGSHYHTLCLAARAWAETALPDPSVIGAEEDSFEAAEGLESYCWDEGQRIGAGAPEGVKENDWREACVTVLSERIEEHRSARVPSC